MISQIRLILVWALPTECPWPNPQEGVRKGGSLGPGSGTGGTELAAHMEQAG